MILKTVRKTLSILFILSQGLLVIAQDQPNVVLFFVDDMGWADVNFRNKKLQTPNINQLKKEGVEFSRAYIATPTCSPSRASLLTGKEPVRFQMVRHIVENEKLSKFVDGKAKKEFHTWNNDPAKMPSRNWLPLEEVTYAEALKEYNYYNMMIGKWHLGNEKYYPKQQGFDEDYHTTDHGHPNSYYAPFFKSGNPFPITTKNSYLTDVLTDKAEQFISDYDKEQPFMLSFWYYNVHGPHQGRKDWVERYKKEGLEESSPTMLP